MQRHGKLVAVIFAVSLAWACGADNYNLTNSAESGKAENEDGVQRSLFVIGAEDQENDGKTFTMTVGQDLVVKLPGNNEVSDCEWDVATSSRTLSYPMVSREDEMTIMTWSNISREHTLAPDGHKVRIVETSPAGETTGEFHFTVKVVGEESSF